MPLALLSGGAAHGLIKALTGHFEAATGDRISGTYGSVGEISNKLMAGAPADLVILTRQMIIDMEADGRVVAGSRVDIGVVHAGIAVREGDAAPRIGDAGSLRAVLETADAVYFPDPVAATAGIHFAGVLRKLGLADTLGGRIRTFPNGATAMAALAAHRGGNPIGSTQITEILGTPGIRLVGRLPAELELATTYSAAVPTRATAPDLARVLIDLLTGAACEPQRMAAGFGPA